MSLKVRCPICKIKVRNIKYKAHLRKAHKHKLCVACDIAVPMDSYDDHLREVHEELFLLRQEVLRKGGRIIGRPKRLGKVKPWSSDNEKKYRTKQEEKEIVRRRHEVSGGAYGLGKSRKH